MCGTLPSHVPEFLSLLLEPLVSVVEKCCMSLGTRAFALSRTLVSPDQSQEHLVAGRESWAQRPPALGAVMSHAGSSVRWHWSVTDQHWTVAQQNAFFPASREVCVCSVIQLPLVVSPFLPQ